MLNQTAVTNNQKLFILSHSSLRLTPSSLTPVPDSVLFFGSLSRKGQVSSSAPLPGGVGGVFLFFSSLSRKGQVSSSAPLPGGVGGGFLFFGSPPWRGWGWVPFLRLPSLEGLGVGFFSSASSPESLPRSAWGRGWVGFSLSPPIGLIFIHIFCISPHDLLNPCFPVWPPPRLTDMGEFDRLSHR
jgi:hypothetical protein